MNQHVHSWSDDRVQKLKDLQASGLSCSEIAAALGGLSRSAVIGKLHRLGLATGRTAVRVWNAQRVRDLQVYWSQRKSVTEIAAVIGCTENSVMNKARRLGLVARQRQPNVKRTPNANYVPRQYAPRINLANIPKPGEQFKCSLFDLVNDTCRWPLWETDSEPKFYCGTPEADCKEGKSYCRYHTALGERRNERELEPFR